MSLIQNDIYNEQIVEAIESYGELEVISIKDKKAIVKIKTPNCINILNMCESDRCDCNGKIEINYNDYLLSRNNHATKNRQHHN